MGSVCQEGRVDDEAGHCSGKFKNRLFLKATWVVAGMVSISLGILRRVWMIISGWQKRRMGKSDVPTPREV